MTDARPHPIRCRCGTLRGELRAPASVLRATCYCTDCRAWAHVLGRGSDLLDAAGGMAMVAAEPSSLRFTNGQDRLACATFSKRGLLRWYASCCRTPMGNTVRDPKQHFVGLARMALDPAPLPGEPAPPRLKLFTRSATRPVAATPIALGLTVSGILVRATRARLTGRWRRNPYFADVDAATPVRTPVVVDRASPLPA